MYGKIYRHRVIANAAAVYVFQIISVKLELFNLCTSYVLDNKSNVNAIISTTYNTHTHTCIQMHTYIAIHTYIHSVHARIHIHAHTYIYKYTHKRIHIHAYTHTHACTCTHTNAHTHAHTHACAHT